MNSLGTVGGENARENVAPWRGYIFWHICAENISDPMPGNPGLFKGPLRSFDPADISANLKSTGGQKYVFSLWKRPTRAEKEEDGGTEFEKRLVFAPQLLMRVDSL